MVAVVVAAPAVGADGAVLTIAQSASQATLAPAPAPQETAPEPQTPAPTEPAPVAPSEPIPAPQVPVEPAPPIPVPEIPAVPAVPAPDGPSPVVPEPEIPTVPTVPTPVEPAPVEPLPEIPEPTEPTPENPAPAEPTPSEPEPVEPAPIVVQPSSPAGDDDGTVGAAEGDPTALPETPAQVVADAEGAAKPAETGRSRQGATAAAGAAAAPATRSAELLGASSQPGSTQNLAVEAIERPAQPVAARSELPVSAAVGTLGDSLLNVTATVRVEQPSPVVPARAATPGRTQRSAPAHSADRRETTSASHALFNRQATPIITAVGTGAGAEASGAGPRASAPVARIPAVASGPMSASQIVREQAKAQSSALQSLFAETQIAPPAGPANGQSLLSSLASYVLPGSGTVPTSLLLMVFAQIAVIWAALMGARDRRGERLVAMCRIGASDGHRLAVQRPG